MVFKSENLENLRVEEEVQLWLHKVFDTIVYWFCQQTIEYAFIQRKTIMDSFVFIACMKYNLQNYNERSNIKQTI